MRQRTVRVFFTTILAMTLVLTPAGGSAAEPPHWLLPACVDTGDCTTCDLIQLMVNWGQGSIPILGLFAVLMFVFGGFWWLISAGDTERITRGKQIMIGAALGLVLALLSYIIVTFTIAALSGASVQDVKIFGQKWDQFSCPQ